MNEEEQEKLYKLLFKDTKNKLEITIEKLRIANTELRDELDKKNSEIEEQQNKIASLQKEIERLKQEMEERLIGREEITKYEMGYEIENNYISKYKIKEHLKRFEEIEKEFIFIDNKSTAREINKALIEFSKRLLEE